MMAYTRTCQPPPSCSLHTCFLLLVEDTKEDEWGGGCGGGGGGGGRREGASSEGQSTDRHKSWGLVKKM